MRHITYTTTCIPMVHMHPCPSLADAAPTHIGYIHVQLTLVGKRCASSHVLCTDHNVTNLSNTGEETIDIVEEVFVVLLQLKRGSRPTPVLIQCLVHAL